MIDRINTTDLDVSLLKQLAISPSKLQDDFCDYSKVVVRKPWGYEYLIFQNELVAVWILYLKKDAQTSMHCHPSKKTSLIVLEGEVECSSSTNSYTRKTAEGLLIEKGAFHQTRAISEKGAFIMEIETPVNKRDLVRLKDKYGREGKGYESSDQHSRNIQNYNYLTFSGQKISGLQKKRFGHCSLSFKRLNSSDLNEVLESCAAQDKICLLNGDLFGEDGKVIAPLGDTLSIAEIRNIEGKKIPDSTEILIIKRVDTDIKVSDFIVNFLKDSGVSDIFVTPGDSNVHLLDSLGRTDGINCFAFQSETGASLSAEGYGKTQNRLATIFISSGGSGPHALPGVANSWIDSTPLLVISGQARSDQGGSQNLRQLGNKSLNIIDVVKPVTKYAIQITDPLSIGYHLEKAISLATSGRAGPVWLDIPIDLLGMMIDQKDLESFKVSEVYKKEANDLPIKEVVELLQTSERPVILAGSGIRLANGNKDFIELINRLNIPVLTSRRGADLLSETDPLFIGRPGSFGQRRANFALQNADLVLSLGSRLSIPLIGRNTVTFARAAKKIVVDIDPNELTKDTVSPDLAINCSASQFIDELLRFLPAQTKCYPLWWEQCRGWKERYNPLSEGYKHNQSINPYLFLNSLSKSLKDDEVIVIDGGSVMHISMQCFEFKRAQRLISSTGLELPGFAIGGAVGSAITRLSNRVICICEDRGFQVGIHELQSVIDNNLPIIIFVLQSKGHSTVRKIQKDFFGARYVGTDNEMLFGSPNLLKIGEAYGFSVSELSDPKDIDSKLEEILSRKGPAICAVSIDSEQELVPRMGFALKDDGKWIAKPLEDMYPFLEREVLKREMLVELVEES